MSYALMINPNSGTSTKRPIQGWHPDPSQVDTSQDHIIERSGDVSEVEDLAVPWEGRFYNEETGELFVEQVREPDISYGTIADMDATRGDKKFLKVKRTRGDHSYSGWCYVSRSIKMAYEAGNLAVGDYVVLDFVDEDTSKPFVIDKVVGV